MSSEYVEKQNHQPTKKIEPSHQKKISVSQRKAKFSEKTHDRVILNEWFLLQKDQVDGMKLQVT